jgi:hypothetical protein
MAGFEYPRLKQLSFLFLISAKRVGIELKINAAPAVVLHDGGFHGRKSKNNLARAKYWYARRLEAQTDDVGKIQIC